MNKFIVEERLQVSMKMSIPLVDIKAQIKATWEEILPNCDEEEMEETAIQLGPEG